MKKIFVISFLLIIFITILLPTSVFADQTLLRGNECLYDSSLAGGIKNIVTIDCIAPIFANLIYWLIILSGTVAVFLIIFGGIKFLTSSGDQAKVESAKKTITWSIIGLVVVLLSFMIVNIIADLTGANCITRFGFTACGNSLENSCGGSKFGTCANKDKACVYTNGKYSCVFLCSKDHTDGFCKGAYDCMKVSKTSWGCRLPCNKTNKENGVCPYPRLCQEKDGAWACILDSAGSGGTGSTLPR